MIAPTPPAPRPPLPCLLGCYIGAYAELCGEYACSAVSGRRVRDVMRWLRDHQDAIDTGTNSPELRAWLASAGITATPRSGPLTTWYGLGPNPDGWALALIWADKAHQPCLPTAPGASRHWLVVYGIAAGAIYTRNLLELREYPAATWAAAECGEALSVPARPAAPAPSAPSVQSAP